MATRIFQVWCEKSLAVGLVSAAALLFSGCRQSSGGRVYLLSDSRIVSGALSEQANVDYKKLQFSLIDSTGFRVVPDKLQYDSRKGQFSFQLRDSDLSEPKKGTALDQLLSMGNALPVINGVGAEITGKADKFSRIEIMPKPDATAVVQSISYFQGRIPLTRRNILTARDAIAVGGRLTFLRAGFVRIRVTDENGQAVPDASVAGVSQGKLSIGDPLWHDPVLQPIFSKTAADGTALIGPLDTSESSTRYQILAVKSGYCTYMSAPTFNFSLSEKSSPVVQLRKCEATGVPGVNALMESFPEGNKYFDVKGRKVLHVNQNVVTLRLDPQTDLLRGLKVAIYEANENFETQSEPLSEVEELDIFQSDFRINLQTTFPMTNSVEGRFVIKFERIFGLLDGANANTIAFPDVVIYGHRRSSLPLRDLLMKINVGVTPDASDSPGAVVDDWTNFKISNSVGVTNIVPGLAGGKFTLASSYCGEGDSLGFRVAAYLMAKPTFKDCVNGVATFTAEEAGFVEKIAMIQQMGTRQKWEVFIRDKFGNVSESLDDPNATSPKRLNVVTVVVDVGRPVSSGVAAEGLPLTSLEFWKNSIDGLGNNKLTGSSKPLKLAEIKSGSVLMRFEKLGIDGEATCIQPNVSVEERDWNGSSGLNAVYLNNLSGFIYRDDFNRLTLKSTGDYENLGLLITRWGIGGTATAPGLSNQNAFLRCRQMGSGGLSIEPVVRVLRDGDIAFPASGPAEFFLRLIDGAGNLSLPISYSIPSCDDDSTGVCWSN